MAKLIFLNSFSSGKVPMTLSSAENCLFENPAESFLEALVLEEEAREREVSKGSMLI